MKIQLWVVGKTTQNFVEQGLIEFCGRIKHYLPFEMQVIPDIKDTKNLSSEQVKEKEGERILKAIQTGDYIVLLDEHGGNLPPCNFRNIWKRKRTLFPNLWFLLSAVLMDFHKKYRKQRRKKSPCLK